MVQLLVYIVSVTIIIIWAPNKFSLESFKVFFCQTFNTMSYALAVAEAYLNEKHMGLCKIN